MKSKGLFTLVSGTCLILMLAALPFISACAQPTAQPGKVYELNLAMQIGPKHGRWLEVLEPWTQQVETRTNGRVKIVTHFSNALFPSAEAYDSIVAGVADIAENAPTATSGRFPLLEVLSLSPIGDYSKRSSRAYWEYYKAFPEVRKQYSDVKVLWLHSIPPQHPATIHEGKPILSLEDMKGKKMVTFGTWQVAQVKALGASLISLNWGEVYMALEKGVADGYVSSWGPLTDYMHAEVIKNTTRVGMIPSPFYMIMNVGTWNSLPKDIQKVFDELSGDYMADLIDDFNTRHEMESLEKAMNEFGVEYNELSASELSKWAAAVKPVRDQWANEMEAKGFPGKKLLEGFDRIWQQYAGD